MRRKTPVLQGGYQSEGIIFTLYAIKPRSSGLTP